MTQLATLVERLRGIIRIPVNDGAGLLDGKDFFERSFPTSNLAREAANEIERLTAERERTERNRDMWKGQCERQAAQLTKMRSALQNAANFYDDLDRLLDDGEAEVLDGIATALKTAEPTSQQFGDQHATNGDI